MKTGAFCCFYSNLWGSLTTNRSFWLGWKFWKLCDTSNCNKIWILLLAFLFKAQFPSKLTAFATSPLKPQPVTSMQNSEILSRYLFSYSVAPQRLPTSASVLPQYHTSPCPISSNAPLLPGEEVVVTSLFSYLLIQQHFCKRNLFLFYLFLFFYKFGRQLY